MTSASSGESHRDLGRLIATVGAVGLVLLGSATLVGLLDGLWWVFDLVAALRFHYMLGFLILTAVFIVLRIPALVLVGLAGALINGVFILPLYLADPAPPANPDETLQIMFLNVEIRAVDQEELISGLRMAEHDLVIFSAATDSLAQRMGTAAIPYTVVQSRPPGVDVELLVLARQELSVDTGFIDFGSGGRDMAVQIAAPLGGETVDVLAMHPVSPMTPARARRHSDHLESIASWVKAQSGPVVVVGDLNATPWSADMKHLLREGALVNSQDGFGLQSSFPNWLGPFGLPIDHALHSEDLTTVYRRLGQGYGSEHSAVHVTVALAGNSSGPAEILD